MAIRQAGRQAGRQAHGGYERRKLDLNLEPEAGPEPGLSARAGLKPKTLVGAGMAMA